MTGPLSGPSLADLDEQAREMAERTGMGYEQCLVRLQMAQATPPPPANQPAWQPTPEQWAEIAEAARVWAVAMADLLAEAARVATAAIADLHAHLVDAGWVDAEPDPPSMRARPGRPPKPRHCRRGHGELRGGTCLTCARGWR